MLIMERIASDRAAIDPCSRAERALRTQYERSQKQEHVSRKVRVSPTVSWYGKILIVGALLVTMGYELFRLMIALVALD
ncbi:hypothetical protein ACVWW6_005680 [Bradyrhizobium sp. USDA 3311]